MTAADSYKGFLQTDRLYFALWELGDYSKALRLWGNPNVIKYISSKEKFSGADILQRLKEEIRNQEEFRVQYWPVYLRRNGEFVGCCGLRVYDLEKGIYEAGFHLCEEFWGNGYASEALKAILRYAFRSLGARGVCTGHHPKNAASKRIIEKFSFQHTSDTLHSPNGLEHPIYIITRDEHIKRQKALVRSKSM